MLTGLPQEMIAHIHDYLPYLSYNSERALMITDRKASDLISIHHTPSLLYVEDRLSDNYFSIRDAFAQFFPDVRIFFALKSCYLAPCVQLLQKIGANIEVMSDIELQIAQQTGFAPHQIVTNGIGRSPLYLERSLCPPVHLTIIDGMEDLLAIQKMAQKQGGLVDIGLRVIPPSNVDGLMIKPSSKLGMDWDGGIFTEVLQAALAMPELRVEGILIHQFSHGTSVAHYGKVMAGAVKVIKSIWEQTGHAFHIIDIGGGFDSRFLLESHGTKMIDFAREAWEHLSTLPYKFTLQVEPGRYIVADAAIGLTRIMAEKHNQHLRWRICDISSNVLIPLPDIAYHPIPTRYPEQQTWLPFHVGDATCAPSLVCADALLPVGEEGRELALLNCGGYTTVFAELWAFPLPTILYMSRNGIQEIFQKSHMRQLMEIYYGYNITP